MPVIKCLNGKYRVGNGACIYDTEAKAEEVWTAIRINMADSYNDYPESAVNNAKRALKYVEENGWGSCGTPVGKIRANQLANRENITRDTIARMASFKRHQQSKDVPYGEGCGGLMWDCWGGTEGIEWAIRKLNQIDNEKETFRANVNKVSFDFDDTLSTARGQEMAKRFIFQGKQVFIITRRNEYNASEVYRMAEKLGILRSRVYFTNGSYKWMTIKRLDIGTHYDNNIMEINLIKINTDCKAIKF